MKFKFLIVLTIVLSVLCVLPVNANTWNKEPNITDLGYNPEYSTLSISYDAGGYSGIYEYDAGIYGTFDGNVMIHLEENNLVSTSTTQPSGSFWTYAQHDVYNLQGIISYYGSGHYEFIYYVNRDNTQTGTYERISEHTIWSFNVGEIPVQDFNIDIDKQEQTLELGNIDNLNQQFTIGSQSDRVIKEYQGYQSTNCDIVDLDRHNIEIRFNKDYTDSASIYLFGKAQKGEEITDFTTTVYFNFTYEDLTKIPFEIEFIDYDKGLQVIGANLTVYYYDESSNTLTQTYRNANCNGLERIEVINNSVLFLEYDLTGYNAVNIDSYDFLNNRQGKLIDSNLKSARLYFSKIDPSVLLFQGFIIKDSFGNALSGVSVTMDNNQTVISNQYGGVRFDNINQGSHTFIFSKTGYYSQSLSKSVTVSNTQNILLVSSQPTTAPTVKPTPLQTDSSGNIIIEKPSNLSDSIKYGLAKIFGITSIDSINLIFALILILFPAVIGGTITNQALGFISGGMIGFVFALAVGLIPIWVFFSMVMFAVIYLILTHSNDGF